MSARSPPPLKAAINQPIDGTAENGAEPRAMPLRYTSRMTQSPALELEGRSIYDGQRMSVEQYLALPEEKPYLEYVDGVVIQKAMPNKKHMILAGELIFEFVLYSREHGGTCGPEGRTRLATERFRLPDVAYWALAKPLEDGKLLLPPTLAVEIRSPDETRRHQRDKCRMYREHGVEVCWLFDPEARTVERFEGDADAEPVTGVLQSSHLPGFSLALAELWSRLDDR
ncbi:hypothetical protein AYO38_02160 [bacterium SCGC AG-212-C10]|nr:hypothetical protein AYO38_02160 [bacterium SCGC AG-212-C10]